MEGFESRRAAACVILNGVKDSLNIETSVEEYVKNLSEESVNEILMSAAKVINNATPELTYMLGYDVYNESIKLRHIGIVVRNSNSGNGCIIQLIQDRKSSLYDMTFHNLFYFSSKTHKRILDSQMNGVYSEHQKWNALGSIETPEEVALQATSRRGKTGSYVYGHTDTRFTPFMKERRCTAITLNAWLNLLNVKASDSKDWENEIINHLGGTNTIPQETTVQYSAWGSW